jgi:radical SAM superfamily enzyme YgiQ (UPF0313 family)
MKKQNHCLLFTLTEEGNNVRPVGTHRIATWLRAHDWDAEVIDWASQWTLDDLKLVFQLRYNSNTKFIGFGNMFNTWTDVLENFCAWVKIEHPEVIILSGAAAAPLYTSHKIDYYIAGYAENAIIALLQWLFSDGSKPTFEMLKINGGRLIDANKYYSAYPMHSLSVVYEDRDFIKSHEWLTIEVARGCKFKCAFCNFPILGVKGDYSREAADFEKQLRDTYDRFGVTNYIIADETFNDRTEKIAKFADVVEKLNFDPYFIAYIRADLLISRPQDRKELLRMNVLGQFYGIESLNTESAKSIGKGMPSEKIKAGLIDIKNYFEKNSNNKYRGSISLIAGLPHETEETLASTHRWILENWQGHAFQAFPLFITKHELQTKSDLSLNYEKYGYTIVPDDYVKTENDLFKEPLSVSGGLSWRNEHMTYSRARTIVESWIKSKYDGDFRVACFTLAKKFKNIYTVEDKLKIHANFTSLLDNDISEYVAAKLNWK